MSIIIVRLIGKHRLIAINTKEFNIEYLLQFDKIIILPQMSKPTKAELVE